MKQPITKVKVLEPRLLSGQKKENIIELYNIEGYVDSDTIKLVDDPMQKLKERMLKWKRKS